MDYKKLKPFKIKEKISDLNYKLRLLKTIRIHPIFYISLLELVPKDIPIEILFELDEENQELEYEVKKIIIERLNIRLLLVKPSTSGK